MNTEDGNTRQMRTFAIQEANKFLMSNGNPNSDQIVSLASKIEKFITNGAQA